MSAGEFPHSPLALPKLDRVTVNQLPGVFPGDLVIRADKQNRSQHAAVVAHKARSIFRHLSGPQQPPGIKRPGINPRSPKKTAVHPELMAIEGVSRIPGRPGP